MNKEIKQNLEELFDINKELERLTDRKDLIIKMFSKRITAYFRKFGKTRFDEITNIQDYGVTLLVTLYENAYADSPCQEEDCFFPKSLLDDSNWSEFLEAFEQEQKEKVKKTTKEEIDELLKLVEQLKTKL